ncbi:MAG: hypothetical protein IT222_12240, partial [Crocinitomix sp.]|nr:hypothetical protein [Crocinitomix sp.]
MNKLWRTELPQVKAVGNENYFYCSIQEDFLYLAQYGVAYTTEGVNVELHQINYENGALNTVKLSELVPMRSVSCIEVLDDKVFVIGLGTKGVFTPYGNKFVAYQPIVVLDKNLGLVDSSKEMPIFVENSDYNTVWGLNKKVNGELEFLTCYALDADGKPTKDRELAVRDIV